MNDLVLRQDAGGAATLTLNRPDKLNALNVELFAALEAEVGRLERQTDSVGLVILRGAGRCFSAGHDLADISTGERLPAPNFQARIIAIQTLNRILHRGGQLAVCAAELFQKHFTKTGICFSDLHGVHQFLYVVIHFICSHPQRPPAN